MIPAVYLILAILLGDSAYAENYVVREGDCISRIVQKKFPGQVYGKKGNLRKVLSLNRKLRRNPHLLRLGQVLVLPEVRKIAGVGAAREEIGPEREVSGSPPEHLPTPVFVQEKSTEEIAPIIANETKTENEEELSLRIDAGYGGRYVDFKQAGAFGGIQGGVLPMNVVSINAGARYASLDFQASFEQFSAEFPGSTVDPRARERKTFRKISLRPGVGPFFAGVEARMAPVVRTSGTTIGWTVLNSVSAVAGLGLKSEFAAETPKAFTLGADLGGAIPVSLSGDGGAAFSAPSGWAASAKVFAEKTIQSGSAGRLRLGMDLSALYDDLKFRGSWQGSTGGVNRILQDYGARIYLGATF